MSKQRAHCTSSPRRLPIHSAKDLVDHYTESSPGYNFVTEIRNKFDTQLLLKKIKATPELIVQLIVQYIRGGTILKAKAQEYAKKANNRNRNLVAQQPVHRTRSVYCHPRGLLFWEGTIRRRP
ncbi:hypothetical protein V1524DRAFT_300452 [Lipomyces starkeyi]